MLGNVSLRRSVKRLATWQIFLDLSIPHSVGHRPMYVLHSGAGVEFGTGTGSLSQYKSLNNLYIHWTAACQTGLKPRYSACLQMNALV